MADGPPTLLVTGKDREDIEDVGMEHRCTGPGIANAGHDSSGWTTSARTTCRSGNDVLEHSTLAPERGLKRLRADGTVLPTEHSPEAACEVATCGVGLTVGANSGTNSASDAHRRGVVSNQAYYQTRGAVRRRITGKRAPAAARPCPPNAAAVSDIEFVLCGNDAAGADEGTVTGISPVVPCDLVHQGGVDGGAEQSSAGSGLRLRADISMGGTRSLECLNAKGIGLARVGAAVYGEMNTQKCTFSCPTSSASGSAVVLPSDRRGDLAGRAAACDAADARSSAVTSARDLPPEGVG